MKKIAFSLLAALVALHSCIIIDPAEPAVDPFPYPESYTANKDLSVKPGDSFFDYCNGTWLASHPIPTDPAQSVGGLYDANNVMEERVRQLKASNPDLGRYFTLIDELFGHSEEAHAYIEAQKAKITRPQSKEEAYRTIGRMYIEGLDALDIMLATTWKKDKLVGVLYPPMPNIVPPTPEQLQEMDLIPVQPTKAGSPSIPALLLEGMGIDLSHVSISPETDAVWEKMWNENSLDDLYQKMQNAWIKYEAYADESGLAAYNATVPAYGQLTQERLRSYARLDLAYVLSYHLQQQFIPQSLKDKYLGITKEIQAALRKRIQAVEWMSETTRQNAIDKLDNYSLNVAFPDTWHMDCIPALADCKSLAEAYHRVTAGNKLLTKKLIGTNDVFSYTITQVAIDSNNEMMSMDLTLVNAAYMPNYNCVLIYPAMLMPPIMPEEGVSEACYYAVFSIIGHEFTHGFDNNGSQWDKYGQQKNWWSVADMMAFQDRKQNLIRTYNNMELDPQRAPLVFCDGDRTQGENIADLGGFLAALDAYKARLDEQGFRGEARREQLRKFYESFAHLWCVQYGDKKFQILQKSDVHSHARLRVNGVVMNTDLWYELYGVNRNNLLYLPKDRRAYIW